MSDPIIPTPQDSQLLLQETTTKTASANTAALDLGAVAGGLGRPLAAVIGVSALDTSDGNETYSFVLQESADNVTFIAAGASVAAIGTGTLVAKGFVRNRYVRLSVTLGGTTPSVTFKAWVNPLP